MPIEDDALTFARMQIETFSLLAAWQAPWQKGWLTIGMLERHWSAEEIQNLVAEGAAALKGKPSITFPTQGWLNDLLTTTTPEFMETALLATEIMHIADGMSEDLRVASGIKKAEDIENRELVEPMYREAIQTFSDYIPDVVVEGERGSYMSQKELLIESLTMALSSHLLLSGKNAESERLYPELFENPMVGLAGLVGRVMGSLTGGESVQRDESKLAGPGGVGILAAVDENEFNAKHLIRTANDEFLSHKPRLQTLEKYSHALLSLGLVDTKSGDIPDAHLDKAARRFIDTPDSTPIIGGLFFAADKILSLRDFRLARIYLLLDAKVRDLKSEKQYGFSKYLNEFMHNLTLAKALMQLGKAEEALNIVEEWATSAETYEQPQDVTGRTIGSLLVTRVLTRYALLLDLSGKSAESSAWWQRALTRVECVTSICELCADRLEVKDTASVKKMLKLLKRYALEGCKTGDLIFYWWILSQVRDEFANTVFATAASREDFINSLADFTSIELLSQRHESAAAELLVEIIEDVLAKSGSEQASAHRYELIGVYLRLAIEYQQRDQCDKADENYKKGLALIDNLKSTVLDTDPKKFMKLTYLRTEFVREYALFLEMQERRDEAALIRHQVL